MPVKAHILNIVNNVLYPSFIVESDGKIVSFNCNGEKIIAGNANSNNFFELFVLESSEQIKQIHQSTLNSNSSVCEHLLLHFRNRTQLETEIVASYIEDQGVPFVFYSFNELKDLNPAKGKVNIRVSTKELIEIIHDQKILRIFDEIKSSYPFTFLGKNKIQNEINKINDLFWLKDIEGKFILINQKYAQLLGLKPSQLEGRYEKEFLPKYLVEFFQAGHDFIEDTANILIREGAAFPLSLSNETMQIVEFPLCDLDNRVIAIVGISQISGKLLDNKPASLTVNSEIIYNLPVSLVCLDEQGEVKVASKKFLELFNFSENVTKSNFQEIFPENISHIIADFISNSGELSFIQKKEVEIPGKENLFFVFDLRKIYNGFGNFEFYCIQIEEVSHLENDGLINNREKMYDIIMQTSPEPMFIYDIENLRFLEVNAAALSIYGFTKNEFLQMDLTDLYAPEDIQTLLDSSNVRNKEGVFTGPWKHKKKDGKTILVEISKTCFEYQEKKAHFNIIRDVSEKLELLKENQLFRAAFENSADLLVVTDADGFITRTNDAFQSETGYSGSDLDERSFTTLVTDEYRGYINSSVFHNTLKHPVNIEADIKKRDGSLLKSELNAVPVFDFSENVIAYSFDIRPEKILQPERKESEKPQAEIVEQTYSVNPMDSAFLSSMFHEILTPMNVILGFIQEITETIEEPTEEQKEAAEIIDQNRILLMQTMDSVLEYTQIEQGKAEVKAEKMNFTTLIDTLAENVKKTASSMNVEFGYGKISSSLSINTDVHKLESLLSMFIIIALRLTKEKKIILSAYQFDESHAIISIKDKRGAISPYIIQSLTSLFSSDGANAKKDYGISKLSIRLAKKLLELLNGKYQIVEKAGEPVEFGLVLPLEYTRQPISIERGVKITTSKNAPEVLAEDYEIKAEEPVYKEVVESEHSETFTDEIGEELDVPIDLEAALRMNEPLKVFENSSNREKEQLSEKVPEFEEEVPLALKPKPEIKSTIKIDLSNFSCLYVEDQVDSQILFKVQMKDLKKVDFAVSFEAALPLLERNKYDFIVMDINLQGEYNGLDALRIIRSKLLGYEKSKIIAVTAYVLPGDKEKFIAAGFNGFISKPLLREKLFETIEKIF